MHLVFADTGWEHPDTEAWCHNMAALLGIELVVVRNPNKTFLTMALNRGKFPGMQQRQCTSDLKRDPINTWIRQTIRDPVVMSAMGLRSEESTGRAKKKKLSRNVRASNSKRTVWDWLPIKEWSTDKVLSYLEENGIPLHPVYQHLKRFSCRVCIFMTEHDVRNVQLHDPAAIDIIAGIEEQTGFTMFHGRTIRQIAQVINN